MSRQPGSVPYSIPPDPRDVVPAKLKDLQDQIDELRTARTLENAQIGAGGISITDNGSIRVIDANGVEIARIGALPSQYNEISGAAQPGLRFEREDGSAAMILADLNPLVAPFKQSLQTLDRAGRVIFADDTNSGNGIANPYLGGGLVMADTNTATWPATTNAAFTSIANGYYTAQNPRLQWAIQLQADAATTGQFALFVGGTQVGTTQTVTGTFATWSAIRVALPAGVAVSSTPFIDLQAKRTAGAGTVRAMMWQFMGDQSP